MGTKSRTSARATSALTHFFFSSRNHACLNQPHQLAPRKSRGTRIYCPEAKCLCLQWVTGELLYFSIGAYQNIPETITSSCSIEYSHLCFPEFPVLLQVQLPQTRLLPPKLQSQVHSTEEAPDSAGDRGTGDNGTYNEDKPSLSTFQLQMVPQNSAQLLPWVCGVETGWEIEGG